MKPIKYIATSLALAAAALTSLSTAAGDINLSLRLQGSDDSVHPGFDAAGVDYSAGLDLSNYLFNYVPNYASNYVPNYGLIVDWRPFSSHFRLSAGAYSHAASGQFVVGDIIYLSDHDDLVVLEATMDRSKSTSAYVGFGWGNSTENIGGFMFSLDLGVTSSELTEDNLSGNTTDISPLGLPVNLSADAKPQSEAANKTADHEGPFSDFDVYPLLMLGVGYRF